MGGKDLSSSFYTVNFVINGDSFNALVDQFGFCEW